VSDEQPDLEQLLQRQRPASFDVWVDPLSPATSLLLPYLDLDGHTNGGRPWRFRGRHEVGMRLLPDPEDELSNIAARCILAARAWAVYREAGDDLVPMDYDLPWSYLGNMLRDLKSVRAIGLPHLVALAGREGEWLGDWVAEHRDSHPVKVALAEELAYAEAMEITEAPSIVLGDVLYPPDAIPDDISDVVARHVSQSV
jgi:hypothetical protein